MYIDQDHLISKFHELEGSFILGGAKVFGSEIGQVGLGVETKDGAANLYWPVKEPLYIIILELPIHDIKCLK